MLKPNVFRQRIQLHMLTSQVVAEVTDNRIEINQKLQKGSELDFESCIWLLFSKITVYIAS